MVCILSQSFFEDSTEEVIRWLRSMAISCLRLNADDLLSSPLKITITNNGTSVDLRLDGHKIDLDAVETVWFRRWGISAGQQCPAVFKRPEDASFGNLSSVDKHLRDQLMVLSGHLFTHIKTLAGSEHSPRQAVTSSMFCVLLLPLG
jgi:hypothetical protein